MTVEPVRKSVTVPLRPDAAFRLFTDGIGGWWPGATHSVSAGRGEKPRAIVVTPGKGGHITEETHDGRRARWATITVYEPGSRLAFDWHVGQGDEEATQVEVTFTPVDAGTRVDLFHDGFAARKGESMAARDSYRKGWTLALGRYVVAGRVVVIA